MLEARKAWIRIMATSQSAATSAGKQRIEASWRHAEGRPRAIDWGAERESATCQPHALTEHG